MEAYAQPPHSARRTGELTLFHCLLVKSTRQLNFCLHWCLLFTLYSFTGKFKIPHLSGLILR